ncbi:MAG TPA: hypothetical protein VG184_12805 [Acidimicrobiales bacterium]|jgi:hypothetical protein|nr:hypothetical protein [Acidimicrobiales bacterium]
MTSAESPDETRSAAPQNLGAPDDTAAFQRFYLESSNSPSTSHGLAYRLLVGWWRDRR